VSLPVKYARPCYGDVKRMRWEDAQRVCLAVEVYAKDGSGQIERINPDDPSFVRVRTQGGYAVVRILADQLRVCRIYATQPLPPAVQFLDGPEPPPED
jgi:hypothetical protein